MKTFSLLAPFGLTLAALLVTAPAPGQSCGSGGGTTISLLPTLGGNSIEANQMNAAGQIAGTSSTTGNATVQAFLHSDGVTAAVGGDDTYGFALNASGQVVGVRFDFTVFETHAALFANGTATDLGTLGGNFSYAVAINDAGQIIGDTTVNDGFIMEAFIYENGTMISLGDLGAGFGSFAVALNQLGTVTGNSTTGDFESHAFLYADEEMIDLGTLGGGYSSARALNDADAVVGESSLANGDTHAFIYKAGVMTDLGTLGGTYSTALAVNNADQVVGYSYTAGDIFIRAFLYSDGTLTDLGTLGGNESWPAAINNLGQVVGYADSPAGQRAFLWQNGTLTDLNTLLPANSGWVLHGADFINDAGRIVGVGTFEGNWQTFILDPGTGTGENHAPLAAATGPVNAECGATITLDGSSSSDPDGDALTYEWTIGDILLGTSATLDLTAAPGSHSITLTVTDPCGATGQTSVTLEVTDTLAPTIVSAPAALNLAVGDNCLATVPDVTADIVATDGCSAAGELTITQSPAANTPLGLGNHTLTVSVTDAAGNLATREIAVVVADETAPVIVNLSASPEELWPANNQMVSVSVAVTATDNCDPAPVSQIISITANVPVQPGDISITSALTASLAATKSNSNPERVYTLVVRTQDATGNETTGSVDVRVPGNQGQGKGPGQNPGKGKNK